MCVCVCNLGNSMILTVSHACIYCQQDVISNDSPSTSTNYVAVRKHKQVLIKCHFNVIFQGTT